jgi:acetyl-CoA carboxylase biotin carboxylase subunit
MGIQTVAVFSEADRDALHVSLADESYCIGPANVQKSYLNMDAILSAARLSGVAAIHPGYGLLSENAAFAQKCEELSIVFIGPSAETITRMGDKNAARRAMADAGVPVIPGCECVRDIAHAREEAEQIGYPLLIKATMGGGGRGMRLVGAPEELERAYQTASAEALSAFGDGGVYMEKYMTDVKHIEIQLICDAFGNVVCLGERECSMQRKNQKLIEESPSGAVTDEVRRAMIEVSTAAAKAARYRGVGTIEYLLARDNRFYFMEMNTRLQVEHPVTEFVTGIDLVKWQIRTAAQVALPFGQEDIAVAGHAIECRINAENPSENYRPSCGRVTLLHIPGGPWVRFDTALYQGYYVPPFYDSMIGKLIVHAPTRAEAIRKMRAALCEMVIEGIEHNAQAQADLLGEAAFLNGSYTTDHLSGR